MKKAQYLGRQLPVAVRHQMACSRLGHALAAQCIGPSHYLIEGAASGPVECCYDRKFASTLTHCFVVGVDHPLDHRQDNLLIAAIADVLHQAADEIADEHFIAGVGEFGEGCDRLGAGKAECCPDGVRSLRAYRYDGISRQSL